MSQVFSYQRILNENGIAATALDGVFNILDNMLFLKDLQRNSALNQNNAKESPAIILFKTVTGAVLIGIKTRQTGGL